MRLILADIKLANNTLLAAQEPTQLGLNVSLNHTGIHDTWFNIQVNGSQDHRIRFFSIEVRGTDGIFHDIDFRFYEQFSLPLLLS